MTESKRKWSRAAFLASLPKCCLKCQREGIIYTSKNLVRAEEHGQTTLVDIQIAICTNTECRAVFAQRSPQMIHDENDFKYCRADVVFVDTLPYHVSLGGEVSKILAENDFLQSAA